MPRSSAIPIRPVARAAVHSALAFGLPTTWDTHGLTQWLTTHRPANPSNPAHPEHPPDPVAQAEAAPRQVALDRLGRPWRTLRLSVTDRCNFRCGYCMPRSHFGPGHAFLPRDQVLSFEEMVAVARCGLDMGLQKVKITGGEPLLRRDLPLLIESLSSLHRAKGHPPLELGMTTNGSLLTRHADELRQAGLTRLNISLDAIDRTTFSQMADVDVPLTQVLDGIEAARRAGFDHIALNTVVRPGHNVDQLPSLARHAAEMNCTLRLIEYMDVGNANGWAPDHVLTLGDMLDQLGGRHLWEAQPRRHPGQTARPFRHRHTGQRIEVVASISQPFCSQCDRWRLSADGHLYNCLFATQGMDIRPWLRADASPPLRAQALATCLTLAWKHRAEQHSADRSRMPQASPGTPSRAKVEMSHVGG